MARVQYVVFEVAGREFGVEAGLVNGIIRANKVSIQMVPNSSDAVEGMINWRGKVSYVLNMRKKFRIDNAAATEDSKIIMAYTNNSVVGFLVDEVTDIITFNAEEIEAAPPFIQKSISQCVTGIGKMDERLVVMLNVEKLLDSDDADLLLPALNG
jgi:purine-binding chemotaxis protein CheW